MDADQPSLIDRFILDFLADLLAAPKVMCFNLSDPVYMDLWHRAYGVGLRGAWTDGAHHARASADFWVDPHVWHAPNKGAWVIPRTPEAELWWMMNVPEVSCKS